MADNKHLVALAEILQLTRPVQVVDIGANPIGDEAPYAELLGHGLCRVIGFEPQAEALQQLDEKKSDNETYLPYAIGNGETRTFNICHHRGWSSTLTPSSSTLEIFGSYKENARIIGQAPIETRKLDEVSEIGRVDLLKIDIQGGEMDVFRNGGTKLQTAVAIQTEVAFVNLYDGQPGVGEIDIELRRQGFVPHCIASLKKAMISPLLLNNDPWQTLNQLMEADLVYVRDFRDPGRLDDDQLKCLCLIAHSCYASYDLSLHCLLILQNRQAVEDNSGQRYTGMISELLSSGH